MKLSDTIKIYCTNIDVNTELKKGGDIITTLNATTEDGKEIYARSSLDEPGILKVNGEPIDISYISVHASPIDGAFLYYTVNGTNYTYKLISAPK